MTLIANCPFGFEDGRLVAYRTTLLSRLEVDYVFWNDRRGKLIFDGFVGIRDSCAIGVTVGSLIEKKPSDLVDVLIHRLYEIPPEDFHLRHFQFLDLDDNPMFEIVAKSGSFNE